MAYTTVYSRINWENEPSINTPINATNLNAIDYAVYTHDQTLNTWDTTKADESDLLLCVKTITYDDQTGQFVFTWQNGTTLSVDLNIEKIPVSFSMDANGIITMTTDDGSTYTADVGSLIKTYSFADSSVIDFTVTDDGNGNKTITAGLVDGSITGDKLQPNYLADCQSAKTDAETAEGKAEDSAEDAEAWAVGQRNGVDVTSDDPTYHNNSKYWSEQANVTSLVALTDTDINAPADGQVLTYDNNSSKWINADASGGLLPNLLITSDAGSTVTVVTPDSETITATQVSGSTTQWECEVDGYGVYTVHALLNGDDATQTVTVDTVKVYSVINNHFSATITVTFPYSLGATCVCSNGSETYTADSSPYTFTVRSADTYTITTTLDSAVKTNSVTITTDGESQSVTVAYGTINVTLDNDFVGESITCTDGVTTITKTAETTSLAFYPPNTGAWTISGTVSGTTYSTSATVSDLSVSVSATLNTTITLSVTLYSATEDTVTYTDIYGNTQTEVFSSGESSKVVSIEIMPEGSTITFTSSVAKNPDDLTEYYSRNISLTTNTSEVYLMPNNCLYWYGYNNSDNPIITASGTVQFDTNRISIPKPSSGTSAYVSTNSENLTSASAIVETSADYALWMGTTQTPTAFQSDNWNYVQIGGKNQKEKVTSTPPTTGAYYIGDYYASTGYSGTSYTYAIWYE